MKLIKLSEYVNKNRKNALVSPFEDDNDKEDVKNITKIYQYTKFITQPLNIGMFIPARLVNGKREVLEGLVDPCEQNNYCIDFCQGKCQEEYKDELIEYQKAKENVLFKNINIKSLGKGMVDGLFCNNKEVGFCKNQEEFIFRYRYKTIEDLIPLELELTKEGIKQSGL